MLKFLLSLGVVYFVIESLKHFVVKAMEKEKINNKLIQMDKLFAENEMQIQKKLDFSTQKIAAITKQANKLEVDANQFVQACSERSEQLVKLTDEIVALTQQFYERISVIESYLTNSDNDFTVIDKLTNQLKKDIIFKETFEQKVKEYELQNNDLLSKRLLEDYNNKSNRGLER